MSISIQIHRSIAEVGKFTDAWRALEEKTALTTRADHASLMHWWERYGQVKNRKLGQEQQLCVVAIQRGRELAACLPLELIRRKKRFFLFTELVFLSQPMNGALLDIVHDGLTVAEVVQVFLLLKKQLRYDLLNLSYLPENSILRQAFAKNNHLHSAIPFISVAGDYDEVRKNEYSQNLKQVLNKFKRRIDEAGRGIEGRMLIGRAAIEAIKEQIQRVSLTKLKAKDMHSVYADPLTGERYFSTIMEKPEPYCSIYVKDGGDLLAYNLGFRQNDVVYFLDTAFDREYADARKIGLGILALDQMVRHYAGKCRVIELGFGLDDYKFRFTKRAVITFQLLLPGRGLLAAMLFRWERKKMVLNGQKVIVILKKYDIPLSS